MQELVPPEQEGQLPVETSICKKNDAGIMI